MSSVSFFFNYDQANDTLNGLTGSFEVSLCSSVFLAIFSGSSSSKLPVYCGASLMYSSAISSISISSDLILEVVS